MLSREQEKQLEIQRQEIIKTVDVILDKVCLSNDYELYGRIEREIDDNLTGFKWFDIEKLQKIESILKTSKIVKRLEKEEDLPQKKQKKNNPISNDLSSSLNIKSKRGYALTFYIEGMSVKELSVVSGVAYMYCYNALKSINKI